MAASEDFTRALAYFSQPNHLSSYEIKLGEGKVMFSAPHAVLQTRRGALKQAERYTGMLCLLLHERLHLPCIYKTRHMKDDANFDPVSEYREALCQTVKKNGIAFVLDLHQLSPERPMDVCLCTGRGKNLGSCPELPGIAQDILSSHRFEKITLDDPFDASSPHTIASTVAQSCRVCALQIEINTRLLMETSLEQRFFDMLEALGQIAHELDLKYA